MKLFKRIPIQYKGELHDVRLVNFSVDMNEVRDKVPSHIKIRDFNGRALFSMVDVKLKRMHPAFLPSFCHFNYRHIAFRLLVDDSAFNEGASKGIYFYKSFTNSHLIAIGGKMMTDYNLEVASIEEKDNNVSISTRNHVVKYCLSSSESNESAIAGEAGLEQIIGALDRAYSLLGQTLRVTQIQREKWPIKAVNCSHFENTFFKTARFEGAFRVFETIYYRWLPPKSLR